MLFRSEFLSSKAFDCVDHNKLWKILKEMGIPDHLTCFLRNLYAGQEATVRTGNGTATVHGISESDAIEQLTLFWLYIITASLVAQSVKTPPEMRETACNAGELGSISGRPPGEGNGSPLQYSCLGNLVDRGT